MKQNSIYEMRQDSVRKIIGANHLNGVLFTSLENICYLCGFTGSNGAFVLTSDGSYFLCDSRYWTQADQEVKGCQIVHYKKKLDGIASLLLDLRVNKIGFESTSLTFSLHHSLLGKLAQEVELYPLEAEIKNLRAVKDEAKLVPPGWVDVYATAINDNGIVVGYGYVETAAYNGVFVATYSPNRLEGRKTGENYLKWKRKSLKMVKRQIIRSKNCTSSGSNLTLSVP